ncbi:uncharacterized protein VTP21DRAFT_8585 [Calcarisporiella thermophila]|uniref:uncharacterized protein n=1 Tax=Calcarisporiella thermophila TaxID=911321 RepID=UPI0037437085
MGHESLYFAEREARGDLVPQPTARLLWARRAALSGGQEGRAHGQSRRSRPGRERILVLIKRSGDQKEIRGKRNELLLGPGGRRAVVGRGLHHACTIPAIGRPTSHFDHVLPSPSTAIPRWLVGCSRGGMRRGPNVIEPEKFFLFSFVVLFSLFLSNLISALF